MSLKTVAIVTVSNSYLKGKEEKCFKLLLEDLNLIDYEVRKFVCICENKYILAHEIKVLTQNVDIIIVIGLLETGIIYKGIAEALSQDLVENDKLSKIIDKLKGNHKKEEVSVPALSKLLISESTLFPIIDISRIFILNLNCFEDLYINILRKHLVQYGKCPVYARKIYIQLNGRTKCNILQHAIPTIDIKFEEEDSKLVCTASSSNFSDLMKFEYNLKDSSNIPYLGSVDPRPVNEFLLYSDAKENVKHTLKQIEMCLNMFGVENIFLSFNGGKDCTVLLHLFIHLIKLKFPFFNKKIFCLYVKSENAFPEQDLFIRNCELFYNLEVKTICTSIKDALQQVLIDRPNFKACLMGTRRTDPHSNNLEVFQMTDPNWPQIMRVSPILDWHYSDIWDYLLYYKVPYCKLYDMGYTSLGNSLNTIRNPCLRHYDIYTDKESYLPAYKMLNEIKERSGRNI